jgi:adenylate cyclase
LNARREIYAVWREDDAQRAIACAVAMQLAMEEVNEENRKDDLPEVEMGIGIHTGQVVLGNIGSPERMKYGVVGRHVNLASRIQSYTTGVQILISDVTRREAGPGLKLGKQSAIKAKGIEHTVTVCEVLGVGGRYRLVLPDTADVLTPVVDTVPFSSAIVEGSHLSGEMLKGHFTELSLKQAVARFDTAIPAFTNLKMHVIGPQSHELPGAVYGKVIETAAAAGANVSIRFTSMAPEIEAYFRGLLPARPEAAPSVPRAAPSLSGMGGSKPRAEEAAQVETQKPAAPAAATASPPAASSPPSPPIKSTPAAAVPSADISSCAATIAAEPPPRIPADAAPPAEKKRGWLRTLHR